MRFAWWPHTTDTRVASYRLRCLQIVDALHSAGHDATLFREGDSAPEVLVLSKRYDAATLSAASSMARHHGTRMVLDLCDNHFAHADEPPDGNLAQRAEALRSAIAVVDAVIVASDALGDVVRGECTSPPPIHVIGDAAEAPSTPSLWQRARHWGAERELAALRRRLSPIPKARRLVWFGNHGSPGVQAGLSDLEPMCTLLESAARQAPLSLTIISNHRERAAQLTNGWALLTPYIEWQTTTFSRALQEHSAALIPIRPNAFTLCKTANRVLSAFEHGLNVIADEIPSYTPFSGCAVMNDWPFGLGLYLDQTDRRESDRMRGLSIARERYSLAAISEQWLRTLQEVRTCPARIDAH